jgi:hypothetical protein
VGHRAGPGYDNKKIFPCPSWELNQNTLCRQNRSVFTTPNQQSQLLQCFQNSKLHTNFFFFLNHQPDALIIPILFCYKTLHVSGIFFAHHQEFYTLHSALVNFIQVSDDRFRAESGWNFHPDSAWKRSSETCMKSISAECTVEDS